jgi:membrane dipeptidase
MVRSFFSGIHMTYIIDAHEDIASSALSFNRNICLSALETRALEKGTQIPVWNHGEATLGWPEYQTGKIALIFATIFVAPATHNGGDWDSMAYHNTKEAESMMGRQLDYYHRLADEHSDQFRLVTTRAELQSVLAPWEAKLPGQHPVGLVLLLEGAEGLGSPHLLEEYYTRGLRQVGPVWAGTRYCAGTSEDRPFDQEGRELLDVMASLNLPLDISHMRESSALTALDIYPGPVTASHANAQAVNGSSFHRHLTDTVIRRLQERGGVIGVVPFNKFLVADWSAEDERVPMERAAAQIDYYCQMSGDSVHAAIGSDFDGGFGFPNIPAGMDTIADLQKLDPILEKMGYTAEDIMHIFHNNWKKHLENILPE